MKNRELDRKTIIIILAIVIILQTVCYAVLATQKAYLHVDEGYSYGLINYDKLNIADNGNFYDSWHDGEYYKDYLTISSEEENDWSPVYENQKNDVHPPFYYFLLRIADSFSIDNFSMWPGITLNIIIHIGITIFTYLIASKIFKNKISGLIIAFASGLTVSALETVMLARMYALTALNILIITYLHMINFEKYNINARMLAIMGACIVIGSLTHYYYLVFIFVIYAIFMVKYLLDRNYKIAGKYTLTMGISAIVSLLIFPYSFNHIFMGYRGQGILSNLSDIQKAGENFGGYLGLVVRDAFNYIGAVIIIVFAIIILTKILITRKEITFKIKNEQIILAVIPTLVYFLVIAMGSPYIEIRYIMPICPLIFILGIYAFKIILEKALNAKQIGITISVMLVVMLITPIIEKQPISYMYTEKKNIVEWIEQNHSIPTIYISKKEHNRIMDDVYLFSKIDKSYVLYSENASEENLKTALENQDIDNGLIVFINEYVDNNEYLDKLKAVTGLNSCTWIERMNACDIYYLTQENSN